MSEIVEKMKDLATRYHEGQFRRGPGHIPYIEHPKAVVDTLERWGVTDPVLLAIAWGHDLLEDTQVTEEEIKEAAAPFGGAVLDGIRELSYDKGKWALKVDWLTHLAETASKDICLIKAADRYCNTKDFLSAGKVAKANSYLLEAFDVVEKGARGNEVATNDIFDLCKKISKKVDEEYGQIG